MVKKKKIQCIFLCHFHFYMYYSPIWFISFIFLLCTLVLFFF
jgi:hypothetical protein